MPSLMEELQVYGELLDDINYDVVAIHPLADEPELLSKLGLSSEQIILCDLYWVYENHLFFVTIARTFNSKPRVSYYRRLDIEHGHSFSIRTNISSLTKVVVNKCLDYLATWIENNKHILAETDKLAIECQNAPDDDERPTKTEPIIILSSDILEEN